MAGAQIRRFLILHKELDADDGELTRTQKVRRGFIAERYAPLVNALYDGASEADIATEVTFEDGRKGTLLGARQDPRHERRIRSPRSRWRRRHEGADRQRASRPARYCSSVEDVSLSFGGVKAVTDVSFDIRKGEIRAIIGPNGAGKTSMLNVINGFYQPQHGRITFKGETRSRCGPTKRRAAASRARSRTSRCSSGMTALDNIMAGRTLKMHRGFFWQLLRYRPGAGRGGRASPPGRGDHRLPRDPAYPQGPGRAAALRAAEARRARPRAGDGARPAAARRADGRHEPRGEGGHVALHPRREQSSSAPPSR